MNSVPDSLHERNARLLNALPAIAWSANAHTFRFSYINPAAEKLLGYPASRWLEEPNFWSQHLHPEDRFVVSLCHNETQACRDHELVYRMIAADGRLVWIRDYINVHSVNGEAVELFGVMVDITREREAEEAWKESRDNFRRMVELSPDCIGVHVDGQYVYVNQAFSQLFGALNEAQIVGRDVLSLIDPAYHGLVSERLEQVRAGGSVPYERMKYRRLDGTLVDVEVAALPLRYGNRDAVQVIARDITPLCEAERQRADAEAKFRWIVEQAVVAVYIMSGDRLTYINDTGAHMLGYEPDELMAMDLATLFDNRDCPCEAFVGGPNVARVRRKDGTWLHMAFYPREIVVDGRTIVVGTAADITDSVHAQQALEGSERRYRELVEGVSDILFTVDENGLFVSLSRSFERSTGYEIGEWLGRPFAELFRPAQQAAEHLGGSDEQAIREYELPARSGAVVTLEVVSQTRYVDGRAAGTIGMARDVTESRNAARKLEEAKRMSSLGQVAASLAHEFNNVLMGIQPFIEVIGRNPSGPRVGDALSHITRAIGRGKRASQEVLRFANPKEPQVSAIDIRTWLPACLGQLTASLPAPVTLESSIEARVGLIRGDSEHLEQVVTNLVFNARDALAGKGLIQVKVSRDADSGFVRISVCDDGPGIAPHLVGRIFEPLFTTKRNGTGLGLAIARRLMERQGGGLTVENRAEGGSAFHISVPAIQETVAAVPCPASAATPDVKRILLVEDDLSAGAGLQELLRSEGYETTWVRLAAEAPAAARHTRPQVAIIDVNLPDGNGADLVPLLRAEQKNLPVVLSTGHVELSLANEEERVLSLMKPYELNDLLAAISSAVA